MLAGKRSVRIEAIRCHRAREIEKALRTKPQTPCNFYKIGAARAGILAAKLIIAGQEDK